MKHTLALLTGLLLLAAGTLTTNAAIVQIGDLNFISDAGNASDGLAYLDMTYSHGLDSAAAITAAQLVYADARLAIASEFDDLFVAAGISYDDSLTAADAFTTGEDATISSGGNYDAGALRDALGTTASNLYTHIWTDPDATDNSGTTRDYITLRPAWADIIQFDDSPAHSALGWLIVSDSAVIPEPSSALLSLLGITAIGLRRRRS